MSGTLAYSPAKILRQCFINLGLAADATGAGKYRASDGKYVGSAWPAFSDGEPDSPDSCITVYGTAGTSTGREMVSGQRQEHHGVQVRIRAQEETAGYAKANALAQAMDQSILMNIVTIGAHSYRLWAVTRTSDVLYIGTEGATSKRRIYTINAKMAVEQIT